MILAGSVISTETKIYNHVSINTGSYIDHNNIFHNFSSTGPGVITGGNVTVSEQSFLGIGSVIKDKIFIGKNTVIGGKAFVRKNCKANSPSLEFIEMETKGINFFLQYLDENILFW